MFSDVLYQNNNRKKTTNQSTSSLLAAHHPKLILDPIRKQLINLYQASGNQSINQSSNQSMDLKYNITKCHYI